MIEEQNNFPETNNLEAVQVQDKPLVIKQKPKWPIFLIIFALVLIVAGLVYWLTPWFRDTKKTISTEQSSNIRESVSLPINKEELSTVMTSARERISVDDFAPQLAENSQDVENEEKNVEEIYQEAANSFGIEPTDLQASSYEKSHTALRIAGNFNNENNSSEPIDLVISEVGLLNASSKQMQTDLIINGRWGDLVLNDSGADAFHLSVINKDLKEALVNIELSDYSMILLDRIMNPDKERTAGIISVDSNDIYPYLNNYVKVEEPSSESGNILTGDNLIQRLIDKEKEISKATIGQIENYIVFSAEPKISVDSSDLGLIYVEVDTNKLTQSYEEYWNQLDQYFQENKSLYFEKCQGIQACLTEYGYMGQEEILASKMNLKTLLTAFSIDKAAIVADKETFSYRGFALELSQKSSVFSLLNLPFNDLKITLSTYSLPVQGEEIFQPESSIMLGESPLDKSYGVSDQKNKLYEFNKAYLRTLSKSVWEALLVSGDAYCNIWWQPEFCFKNPDNMMIYDPEEFSQYISLVYPYDFDTNLPYMSAKIYPADYEYTHSCSYSRDDKDLSATYYEKYLDVTTKNGAVLRISVLPASSGEYANIISGHICIQEGNSFSTKLPFSGSFEFYAKEIPFEEVTKKLQSLLETFDFEGGLNTVTVSPSIAPLESKDYPERNQSMRLETVKTVVDNVEQDEEMIFVNNADVNDLSACGFSDQYVTNTYIDDRDKPITVIFPNKQAVCSEDTVASKCFVCNDGHFEIQEDLSACKGLRCNL